MARIVVFNDPHYTRHEPQCRTADYSNAILDKFHEAARIASKIGAGAIGCTGDWFHRKGKVTFRELNDILSVLSSWQTKGIQPIGILGNHDIAGHRLDAMDTRAVGSMAHAKVLQLLDYYPWIDDTLSVTGTSYFHGCDSSDEARIKMYGAKRPQEGGVHVHFAHGTLLFSGTFFEDFTIAKDLIDLLWENDCLPDVITCGHLHSNKGIIEYPHPANKRKKVSFCRVGSLGRVSSDDFKKIPAVLIVSAIGDKYKLAIKEVGKPIKEVNKVREGEVDKEEYQTRITDFVNVLRQEADEWSVADHKTLLETIADKMEASPEALDVALKAVEDRQ